MSKVYSIAIKPTLDCNRCHEKIKQAVCSLCVREISIRRFDEESNTITLIGTFDPKKVMKKICQKAGKCIDSFEVSEVIKKAADSGAGSTTQKKDPPKQEQAGGGGKEKSKAGEKDGAKEKDKGSKEKKDPPSPEPVGPVLVVVVPPAAPPPALPAPDPKPTPAPEPPPKPQREVIICPPAAVVGAPMGWPCRCGPCHCGCYCRPGHETRPCTCRCSGRTDPSSVGSSQCHCVVFSEEDSTCKPM